MLDYPLNDEGSRLIDYSYFISTGQMNFEEGGDSNNHCQGNGRPPNEMTRSDSTQLRRRQVRPSVTTTQNVFDKIKEEVGKPPCCLKCLVNCFGRFLHKKKKRKRVAQRTGKSML